MKKITENMYVSLINNMLEEEKGKLNQLERYSKMDDEGKMMEELSRLYVITANLQDKVTLETVIDKSNEGNDEELTRYVKHLQNRLAEVESFVFKLNDMANTSKTNQDFIKQELQHFMKQEAIQKKFVQYKVNKSLYRSHINK